jgi:SAM-dependent methyltransferase
MNPSGANETETAVRCYFQGRATTYEAASARGLWAWQREREARALLALAGPVAGRAVLDLGCGAGFYARRLAECGAGPVVAVDWVPAMVAAAAHPGIETRLGDAAVLELERRFDRVILAGVLEFAADPVALLRNARRHLASGGRVVALVPPDTFAARLYRRFHRRHGIAIGLFSRSRLRGLAAAADLAAIAWRPVPPYGLACALDASSREPA